MNASRNVKSAWPARISDRAAAPSRWAGSMKAATMLQMWGSDRSSAIRHVNGGDVLVVDLDAEERAVEPPRIAAEPLGALPDDDEGDDEEDRRDHDRRRASGRCRPSGAPRPA